LFAQDLCHSVRNVRKRFAGLGEVGRVSSATVVLADPMFHVIYSANIAPIGGNQLRANSPVTASFRAVIKDHEPLRDIHLPNAHDVKVPEAPDFLPGVSQYL
jgi:hypothetical protein